MLTLAFFFLPAFTLPSEAHFGTFRAFFAFFGALAQILAFAGMPPLLVMANLKTAVSPGDAFTFGVFTFVFSAAAFTFFALLVWAAEPAWFEAVTVHLNEPADLTFSLLFVAPLSALPSRAHWYA